MAVPRQAAQQGDDGLRQPASRLKASAELRGLGRGRQFAPPQKKRHVLERHRPRQVADLVPAVVQPARGAVDGADGGAGGDHVLESGFERAVHGVDLLVDVS